jgi:26S proteasome regulatory subunit N6
MCSMILTNLSLVRTLLDFFSSIPDSNDIQSSVLKDNIDWAKREKRIFLKQSLETRLIALYVIHYLYATEFFVSLTCLV